MSDLNIMGDSEEEKTQIAYSDTNVDGHLLNGDTLVTSEATYKVHTQNDETGSYLVFMREEELGGLPGAIKNRADVYAITDGKDEIVAKWKTNRVTNDLVVNANGQGIIADNHLEGIIVDENYALTMNDVKDFSGFNNAFTVSENAALSLKQTNLSDNTGEAVIFNKGKVELKDVQAEKGNASYVILSDGGSVSLDNVIIDGDIKGENGAEMTIVSDAHITGSVKDMQTLQNSGTVLVENVLGGSYALHGGNFGMTGSLASDNFTLSGGTLDLTKGTYEADATKLAGGNINMLNNRVSRFQLGDVTLSGKVNLSVDADILSQTMDSISATGLEYKGGEIYVENINFTGQPSKPTIVLPFADETLKEYVTADDRTIMGDIYKYSVGYDKETGNFMFVGGGNNYANYNPTVVASPVAALAGGYLTELNSYDEAFLGIDEPQSVWQEVGRHKRGWIRPYETSEHLRLKNGPKVTNRVYGSFLGANSELFGLGNGWEGKVGAYIGYNQSRQSYDDINIHQKGGMLGLVGIAYKNNFFTGLTVNAGGAEGKEKTMYGKKDFSILTAGIASKTGYNIEKADGKLIIQPNILASLSLINTSDYTNTNGLKIKSDTLNALQIEPGVKFIGNLENGWQPYSGGQHGLELYG